MKDYNKLNELLSVPRKIVITTHANPDADALGSSLGLYLFLASRGHEVRVISPTDYPEFLHWMEGNERVLVNSEATFAEVQSLISQAELICCLDFSGLDRIKNLGELVRKASGKKVLIDHHLNPEPFADYNLWDTKASATAELVFDLIVALGGKAELTPALSECLYAGIMTDTGSFRHPSTTPKVHRIVADLMDAGANVNRVARNIYDNNSVNRLKFIGFALSEKLIVDEQYQIGYFIITWQDHQRFGLKSGDTEGLVNYALSIKGVRVAAIIMEKEEEVKMSFRSVGDISVNDFAATYFNGGGHKNAAGGHSYDPLDVVVARFRSVLTYFES